ncbi:PREDICTED: pro-resilin-like [Nicrophorus vespilloides]|uniref:Pro-resilin-like n=1 Tax=Nicrophorus vespilloides TaxID=110193 RepID=A0ABM1MTQ9_NICVS|nr:PREDICTED: pro-resilin-like [Nicrophorus vespilloides]
MRNSSRIRHSHHSDVNISIMNTYTVFAAFVLAVAVVAEPPSGYSYNRPSGGGGLSGGGGYTAVSSGYQTSEGASVDHVLLEQVRQILLKEEQNAQSSHGGGGISSTYGAPSSQYGVPSSQYGVPGYHTRVVGIDLEGIKQAIQVAQYNQIQSIGGYPSGSYGVPSRPSGSYGAPY